MFGFKVSNSLFGPVFVKAELMTTSIEDTESISSAAFTPDNEECSYKYKLWILYHSADKLPLWSPVQSPVHSPDILPATPIDIAIGATDVATQIASSSGIRVLFIFDGWDEFPPELQNNSLITTIIREPHKLCLQSKVHSPGFTPTRKKSLVQTACTCA